MDYMDYMDHIVRLMKYHGATGYCYKDRSDLIGFHARGGVMAWYRTDGNNPPIRVECGTPEEEFNRLQDARFNRLTRGV